MLSRVKRYSFLFEELVKRDFKKKYKRAVLGIIWSLLSPLLMLFVYRIVFTKFFGSSMEHYTTYLFSGHLVFTFYLEATNAGMNSMLQNSEIFSKVMVPKYIFLLAQNVTALVNFSLTLCIYFLFVAIDGVNFHLKFISLIVPVLCLVIFNIGVGFILSAMYVMFRDVQYLYGVLTQVILYCSAIFYTTEQYELSVQKLFLINPIYIFITYFRKIVLYNEIPSLEFHTIMFIHTFGFLLIGILVYKKYNDKFLYYI